jgi:hypothetical protein
MISALSPAIVSASRAWSSPTDAKCVSSSKIVRLPAPPKSRSLPTARCSRSVTQKK